MKRLFLPIWNAVIHSARHAGGLGGAVARGRIERCACCGRVAPMILRPRSIPPKLVELWGLSPRETAALVRKESLSCAFCGAKLRARRLADGIMGSIYGIFPKPRSLREWAGYPASRALRVAEINLIEGVHQAIRGLPGLSASDFGSKDPAIRSEDLTKLSYADESFDLVLTSESLEHVPDLDAALAEIRRVLKPQGRHIFTVPVRPGVPLTLPRSEVGPPIAHPGGDWGYPVFTEFGIDLPYVLGRAGFSTSMYFWPPTEDDLAQVYECRKS